MKYKTNLESIANKVLVASNFPNNEFQLSLPQSSTIPNIYMHQPQLNKLQSMYGQVK